MRERLIPRGEKLPPAPHPHRGFETVTYVLRGTVHHLDSLGNRGSVDGGGIEWMRAGSGIIHGLDGDWPPSPGETVHVLQLWVNLPAADKMSAPAFQITQPDVVPEVEVPGGLVRVVAGEYGGASQRGHTVLPICYGPYRTREFEPIRPTQASRFGAEGEVHLRGEVGKMGRVA